MSFDTNLEPSASSQFQSKPVDTPEVEREIRPQDVHISETALNKMQLNKSHEAAPTIDSKRFGNVLNASEKFFKAVKKIKNTVIAFFKSHAKPNPPNPQNPHPLQNIGHNLIDGEQKQNQVFNQSPNLILNVVRNAPVNADLKQFMEARKDINVVHGDKLDLNWEQVIDNFERRNQVDIKKFEEQEKILREKPVEKNQGQAKAIAVPDDDIRKLAMHRCLDRYTENADTVNAAIIDRNLDDLEGFGTPEQLSHMSNDMKHIISNSTNYTPAEKAELQQMAGDLDWSSKVGSDYLDVHWKSRGLNSNIRSGRQSVALWSEQIDKLKGDPQNNVRIGRLQERIDQVEQRIGEQERTLHSKLDGPCNTIVDRIKTDAVKRGVTIPGGFYGHAVLYQIKQQPNGKYSFTVINTGSGMRNHHCSPPDKVQTHAVWSNLTLEQVSNPDLIKRVMGYSANALKMDPVYKMLNTQFGRMDPPDKKLMHKFQLSGTCTNQCLQAMMHSALPESLYRRFKADLTERTIDLFKKIKSPNKKLDQAILQEMNKVLVRRRGKADEAVQADMRKLQRGDQRRLQQQQSRRAA